MDSIGAYAAKTRLPELLAQAARGRRIVITRHGKLIAGLVPHGQAAPAGAAAAIRGVLKLRASLACIAPPAARTASLRQQAHAGHRY